MKSVLPRLRLLLLLCALLATSCSAHRRTLTSTCLSPIPVVPHSGPGCGAPANIDATQFGDNAFSSGTATLATKRTGIDVSITLRNLSRSDYVLTAWLIWHFPGDPTVPAIYKVADHVSPCAPYTASYSSGMSREEPNRLRYVGRKTASFYTRLNFNPTYGGEGALTRYLYSFQKDVPGIQRTAQRQPAIRGAGGRFMPTSSDYLREYDPKTGYEKLDRSGKPVIVRSPLKAIGIAIVAHIDKTTHGIAPGYLGVDHFEIASFKLKKFGRRTVKKGW